jgi:GntR family transcriptional regulator / MocR family aminotransferase
MTIQWTGLSPDLLLNVDRDAASPLRDQLENQIREAIRAGRLSPGERLPSTRALAHALGLSRGLVQECFGQLQAEGYLTTRIGSATRVAAGTFTVPIASAPVVPSPPLTADFRHGVPDLASFPRGDWLWAMREVCKAAPKAEFDYGDPRGSLVLRDVLSSYLRRVRAAAADAERLVVCTGYAQGLSLALRALADRGVRRVAFEDPGPKTSTRAAAALAGVEAIPVRVDACGLDVEALAATGATAVIVTPAHQWPTGVVLAAERRLMLVSWATERDAVIIEDDYDAEFRYDREPVGALQGLAADRVIAIGTVSKSLAPSVRLGWILCPPFLAKAIAQQKNLSDRGSPGLDQLTLAELIESGRYDRHLRRMRALYAKKRDALVVALQQQSGNCELTGLAAGFHAVLHLPQETTEQAVIAAARTRSVGLYGMEPFRSRPSQESGQLVLGYGNLSERAIQAGIATIGDLLEAVTGRSKKTSSKDRPRRRVDAVQR